MHSLPGARGAGMSCGDSHLNSAVENPHRSIHGTLSVGNLRPKPEKQPDRTPTHKVDFRNSLGNPRSILRDSTRLSYHETARFMIGSESSYDMDPDKLKNPDSFSDSENSVDDRDAPQDSPELQVTDENVQNLLASLAKTMAHTNQLLSRVTKSDVQPPVPERHARFHDHEPPSSPKSEAKTEPSSPEKPMAPPYRNNIQDKLTKQNSIDSALLARDELPKPQFRSFIEKRVVYIKFAFISIFDIETKTQVFTTEVVMQARWTEPRLSLLQVPHGTVWRDRLPPKLKLWDPRLRMKNLEEVKRGRDERWYTVERNEREPHPEIVYRRKVRGAFYQKMELQDFPFDVQAISVHVSTELDHTEVAIKEDDQHCSSIFCEAFRNDQEWKIYEHVQIDETGNTNCTKTNTKFPGPTISASLHVHRKQGYFFWNVYLILTFITLLSFCGFAIPYNLPNFRIATTLTLLLTSVTFKLTIAGHLPTISYLTFLDKYSFMTISFLTLLTIVFAGLAFLVNTPYHTQADWVCFGVLSTYTTLFHLLYYRAVKRVTNKKKEQMDRMDSLYHLKKSKNAAFQTSSSMNGGYFTTRQNGTVAWQLTSRIPAVPSEHKLLCPPSIGESETDLTMTANVIDFRRESFRYHRRDSAYNHSVISGEGC